MAYDNTNKGVPNEKTRVKNLVYRIDLICEEIERELNDGFEDQQIAKKLSELKQHMNYYALSETCIWKEDDNGPWETACGIAFEFINDGIEDNKFLFCPFCGRRIKEIQILMED